MSSRFGGGTGLRIADAIRTDPSAGADAVGRWYTAFGTALHLDSRRDDAGDHARVSFAGYFLRPETAAA